jgi:hypothetical protein
LISKRQFVLLFAIAFRKRHGRFIRDGLRRCASTTALQIASGRDAAKKEAMPAESHQFQYDASGQNRFFRHDPRLTPG